MKRTKVLRRGLGGLVCALVCAGGAWAVSVESTSDEGQDAFKVTTANATYYLQKPNGGLSSLVDADGDDWIGFHPSGSGPQGPYRGLPNLVHPAGYFHPGKTGITSTITEETEEKVTITCNRSGWEMVYDFYDAYCAMTVTQASGSYWFLYEGTPGGDLERGTDFWYIAGDETQHKCSQGRSGDLPDPEWMAFGDPNSGRTLFLAHHDDDNGADNYYTTDDHFTIFGFGRSGTSKHMSGAPNHFSIGIIEATDYATVSETVQKAMDGELTNARGVMSSRVSGNAGLFSVHQRTSKELTLTVASKKAYTIGVFNSFGRKVLSQSGTMPGQYRLSTATLPAGLYLLRVTSGTERYAKTFVLQ